MLISSLTLENVKSYPQATIEFSPGTNAIVGPNGAGKTTILEAIGFALFDHLPYNRADFVRAGQRWAGVAVEFVSDYDERAYQVIRRCGSRNTYTVLDPELSGRICEGKADVMQFLRQHFRVEAETEPEDLFRNAVGVPQGSFTVSFLETPSVRKAIFDPLLKVAEYRRAWERLREPLNLLRQRQNEQAVKIGRLEGELKRLPNLEREAGSLAERIGVAEAELKAAHDALALAQAERQELEVARERLRERQRAAQLQEQRVAERERTLAAARQRMAESEEAVTATEANRAGHEAYAAAQEAQRDVSERMARRRKLEAERAGLQTLLTQAQTRGDAHGKALAEIAEAEKTAEGLEAAAAEQEQLDADMRDVQRQADRLKDAGAQVERLQAAVDAARARLAQAREEAARALEIEASLEPLQARLEALQKEKSAAEVAEAQAQAEHEIIREQGQRLRAAETSTFCPICEQPLSAENRERLLDRLRARWTELTAACEAAASAISQAESAREQTRATLTRRERTLRGLRRQNEVDRAEGELAELDARLAEARMEVEGLGKPQQRLAQLAEALEALGNPRRRRDAALQAAQGREREEAALEAQRAEAARQRRALAALDEGMAAFAGLDAEAARIASQLDEFRSADDLYRRNLTAAEALPQRRQEAAEAEEALRVAQERYESGRAQLAAIAGTFDEVSYEEAGARLDEMIGRSARLEADLGQWRERLIETEAEISQLRGQAQRLAAAQSLHRRLGEREELLQSLRSVLQEAGPFVTKALVKQISYTANQLFGQIMEDYTRTLSWREDYGIILEVDGRERAFAQLSGGEQMSAALAVRLALLQEISGMGVAFFDEPTTNLDDTRRDALARQIVEVQGFEQLFIISHDDSFEQATENLIRVEKRAGASEIQYG